MKVITYSINAYQFNELSDSAKEKVKQWYLDDPFRSEQLTEYFRESHLRYFFPNSKLDIQWSLSSCQGDGVNMYGDLWLSDVLAFIRNWKKEEHSDKYAYDPTKAFTEKELRRLEWYVNYKGNAVDVATIKQNWRYTYCMASSIEFADEMVAELEYAELRGIEKNLIERFENEIKDIVSGICCEMEHHGYEYLYEVEDEEVNEMCDSNDYWFDENGKHVA